MYILFLFIYNIHIYSFIHLQYLCTKIYCNWTLFVNIYTIIIILNIWKCILFIIIMCAWLSTLLIYLRYILMNPSVIFNTFFFIAHLSLSSSKSFLLARFSTLAGYVCPDSHFPNSRSPIIIFSFIYKANFLI